MESNGKDEVAAVSGLPNTLQRAKAAIDLLATYQARVNELSRIRREALTDLIDHEGWARKDLAVELGISQARLSQLLKSGPAPWRALLGSGSVITVAVGEKTEAPKEHGQPGPAVAKEDLDAYTMMSALARDLGFETEYETVSPPGFVDLNRSDLVVICGPRLSPPIGQILAGDPNIKFDKDSKGWYLEDLKNETVFRSPMDSGRNADYAYLGRLPRPDGRGFFLYIAGIHAVGAPGVVHYLSREIADLYSAVRQRRFSCIIRCEFEPKTMKISSSKRVTPVYQPGGPH